VHVRHLSLVDFRSYAVADLPLAPGVTTIMGLNGQGKTNLVEAIGYVATLGSHRVATDQPMVRFGAQQAVIRAAVVRQGRETLVELELTPGRANRARLNKSPLPRTRDVLGTLRTVLFAPEDLALVKGDPSVRRAFLDDLLVARQPRWSGVRSDYDRILKQRNALLKSAAPVLRATGKRRYAVPRTSPTAPRSHHPRPPPICSRREAARTGIDPTIPDFGTQSSAPCTPSTCGTTTSPRSAPNSSTPGFACCATSRRSCARHTGRSARASATAAVSYRASVREEAAAAIAAGEVPEIDALRTELLASFDAQRQAEIERGITLVGPHRDDVILTLGPMPAKGYASHGESWSLALGLKLAAYQLLRRDLGEDPVLVLDDVFAELDTQRRERLASLVADCEQVLVTAAVGADVPEALRTSGRTYAVTLGGVLGEVLGEVVDPTGDPEAREPGNGD
jgi:DNA replication and repair protein RecF